MPTDSAPRPLEGALVLFDLDGTLVETAPDLIGALNRVLAEHDRPALPLASARHLVGHGARALLVRGFAEAGEELDDARADTLIQRFLALYAEHICDESHAYPGLDACLDALEAAGARLAVCTNKPGALSRLLLERLGLLSRFVAVTGADDAPARKPDPRHIAACVAQAGGSDRVLMVGDSATDVAAARAAGVPVAVVSFGYTEIPPAELGGDALVHSFSDLPSTAVALLESGY